MIKHIAVPARLTLFTRKCWIYW